MSSIIVHYNLYLPKYDYVYFVSIRNEHLCIEQSHIVSNLENLNTISTVGHQSLGLEISYEMVVGNII